LVSQTTLIDMRQTRLTIFCSILLSLSCVKNTIAIGIECWYTEASYWSTFDKPYACVIYKFEAAKNVRETITGVSGTIREGSTIDDVIVIDLRGFCNIIPVGFDTIFSNILGFSVYATQTSTVSSDDLKQFPKLRELWIYSNELEYLPSNLLEHNPNMEYIHFNSNKIKFIGSQFFSAVPKMYGADFTGNVCIDRSAGDAKNLAKLKKEIKKKCSSNAADENSQKIIYLQSDQLSKKISNLKKELNDLKDEYERECTDDSVVNGKP